MGRVKGAMLWLAVCSTLSCRSWEAEPRMAEVATATPVMVEGSSSVVRVEDGGSSGLDASLDRALGASPASADQAPAMLNPALPLPDAVARDLAGLKPDPHPKELVRNAHYWVSNENHHYVYKKLIDGHGGVYAGVGTDQNYLMAAWARSPIVIMMDFDEKITEVHQIYGVIFAHVSTPEELIAAWKTPEQVEAWLGERYSGDELKRLKRTLKVCHKAVRGRLRRVARAYRKRGVATFLTDQEHFDFLKMLWKNGRVFAVRGDLTADTTVRHIGDVLRKHGLTMGLFYLSNTEQYFDFTPSYRRNMASLPYDERSLILRTRPYAKLGVPEEGEYHYNAQRGPNLVEWMTTSRIPRSATLLARHRKMDDEVRGLSTIEKEPVPSKKPPQVASWPGAATNP